MKPTWQDRLNSLSDESLREALKKREHGRVVPFKFVKHGVDVWRQ